MTQRGVRAAPRSWWLGLAGLAVLATWLHLQAGYTLPHPWPDESHFLAPALRLAADGQLGVPELNAPEGIFWMPAGYYFLLAPWLALGTPPLETARLISLLGVIGFAAAVAAVAARAGVNRWIALGLGAAWLVWPRVVAAGNIARQEAVVLACAGLALWLISHDRWPTALGVALLAPLLHPVGAVVTVAVAAAGLVRAQRGSWRRGDIWLLAVVLVAWAVQIAYLLVHGDLAGDHLGFQLTRKAGRGIALTPWQWTMLGLAAAGGVVATWRWWRAPAPLVAVWAALALAGGLVVAAVVGREMWYEVLGRETAPLLLAVTGVVALSRSVAPRAGRMTALGIGLAALVAVVVLGVRTTLSTPWFGMGPDPASRGEWQTFVAQSTAVLEGLDQAGQPLATVAVDPLSGFGQEVFRRPWRRLRFVQPTPVTPMTMTSADYLLVTPGAPFVTPGLTDPWPAEPALKVPSSTGRYQLELYRRP